MNKIRHNLNERQVEIFVTYLLSSGVLIATVVVFLGGFFYLVNHWYEAPNYQIFRGEPPAFRSAEGVAKAALSGRQRGIIQFGVLLLIATPIARVFFSLLAFDRQRDFTYMIVTLIVLVGLIISLAS